MYPKHRAVGIRGYHEAASIRPEFWVSDGGGQGHGWQRNREQEGRVERSLQLQAVFKVNLNPFLGLRSRR